MSGSEGSDQDPTATVEGVEIDVGAGAAMPANLYLPTEPGRHVGVLALPSEYGASPGTAQVASYFAHKGFATLVPDLYFRDRQRVLPADAETRASGRIMRSAALA